MSKSNKVSAIAVDANKPMGHGDMNMKARKPVEGDDSVIHTLTEVQLEEFREAFNAFDKDGGGSIDKEELLELFKSLGQTPTDDEIDKMVKAADTDGNGTIDFEEFATLMAHMMVSHDSPAAQYERLEHAFKIFDADGSGNISTHEMRTVLLNLGEPISVEDVDEVVSLFDKDDDGHINYVEFAQGTHPTLLEHIFLAKTSIAACCSMCGPVRQFLFHGAHLPPLACCRAQASSRRNCSNRRPGSRKARPVYQRAKRTSLP